jgi:hypothetical protein
LFFSAEVQEKDISLKKMRNFAQSLRENIAQKWKLLTILEHIKTAIPGNNTINITFFYTI